MLSQGCVRPAIGCLLLISCFTTSIARGIIPKPIARLCVYNGPLGLSSKYAPLATFKKKYALIVGVDQFSDQALDRIDSKMELTSVKRYFVDYAHIPLGNIKLLSKKTATRRNFMLAVERLGKKVQPDDLAIVYVVTRGILLDKDHMKGYLAFSDTNDDVKSTAMNMLSLAPSILNKVHAKAIVLIVNADYGAIVRWGTMPMPPPTLLPPGHTLVILASTGLHQTSIESGRLRETVFGHEFIEALKNDGATYGVANIVGSLIENVKDKARDLDPQSDQRPFATGMCTAEGATDVVIGAETQK